MPRSGTESADEIELRARGQRLEAVQDLWREDFGWRNLAFVGWPILAGIALVDLFLFGLAGQSYPAWYLANGAILSLGIPILSSVGVDLDRRYGLISAHPAYFLGGWLGILLDWSNIWDPTTGGRAKYLDGTRSVRLDRAVSWVFNKALGLGLIAWFVVAAPPQYVLNLVAGAPARAALASGKVVWDYQTVEYTKTTDGSVRTNAWRQDTTVQDGSAAKPHVAARRLGFDVKPVSVTYALSALVLFLLSATIDALT
jgi:hypothetical protein